jgi:hypothetical protein
MPAQRTAMSACHAPGQPSDALALPPFIRQMSQVSARLTSTPDGHSTTTPADSGPTTTESRTAPHAASTAALCAQLDSLRAALAHAGHVDGPIVDILTATVAGLATAVTNTIGRQPATITIAPCPDYWGRMRDARGWTQDQLMTRLERAAARLGQHLPDRDSLQVMVSRWETGRVRMGGRYQRLFRTAYDLPEEQATTVHTPAVA